jgi:hypothetical protein
VQQIGRASTTATPVFRTTIVQPPLVRAIPWMAIPGAAIFQTPIVRPR